MGEAGAIEILIDVLDKLNGHEGLFITARDMVNFKTNHREVNAFIANKNHRPSDQLFHFMLALTAKGAVHRELRGELRFLMRFPVNKSVVLQLLAHLAQGKLLRFRVEEEDDRFHRDCFTEYSFYLLTSDSVGHALLQKKTMRLQSGRFGLGGMETGFV